MSAFIRARTTGNGTRRYDVRYRRGGRAYPVEHAGTFRTEREAKIRLRLVQDMLAAGKNPRVELARQSADAVTVRSLAEQWIAGRRDLDTSTIQTYRGHVERIAKHMGSVAPADVEVRDVQRLVAVLSDDLAPGTVAGVVGTLRMILDLSGLPHNPARSKLVKLPRNKRATLEPPTVAETLAAFRHASPRYRQHLVVLEQTGLRVSELLGVRAGDVDAAGCRIRVRGEVAKRDRPRWVDVGDWLLEHVRFPVGGSRQLVWHALATGCDEAGVRRFGPHQLRHRRASLWHQQGVAAVELARRLGHAKPSMSLDVYAHVMPLGEIPVQDLVLLLSSSTRS